ncbi:MAG: DUF1588 domain-containing protein [Bryobacterales bacterium]|nr:DUF1588 domain-containing protein [Bryobacterales bacterium]
MIRLLGRARLRVLTVALLGVGLVRGEPVPTAVGDFLSHYCAGCHSVAQPPNGVRLPPDEIEWRDRGQARVWERVQVALATSGMPPAGAPQPDSGERARTASWVEAQLLAHSGPAASIPRRLNRAEYRNTIRALFDMPEFELPASFPADSSGDGFDNLAHGLTVSGPLLAEYVALAARVADEVLPPKAPPESAPRKSYALSPTAFDSSAGRAVADRAFRIVSSRNMASAAAWPSRFEAAHSGVYRVTVRASVFQSEGMFYAPREKGVRLGLYARPKTGQFYAPFGDLRKVAEFSLPAGNHAPAHLSAEVELYAGELFGIRWEDGPAYSDPPRRDYSHRFLADRLTRDRLYYAAMLEFGGGPRGTTQEQVYEATRALMESGTLDLSDPRLDGLPEVWGGGLSDAPHNWIKAFVHEEMMRFGPAVDVSGIEVVGPVRLVEDAAARARRARAEAFAAGPGPEATARERAVLVLGRFLAAAFRRPATSGQVRAYADLALQHVLETPGARLEDGLRLAVRQALVSPRFLYRGLRPGPLDQFDFASRLSYFLTSAPPDEPLLALANRGALAGSAVLAGEVDRLLASKLSDNFVRSFAGQWLSTRTLKGIMPDPRLLKFYDPDREALVAEAEMFFAEILRKNLPVETFIEPGFSYRSARHNKIYGTALEGNQMRRVTLQPGDRHAGLLGMAAVMMATANGVDTNPVPRGVWVLENILGRPPGEPPPSVPAIAPDTRGAPSILAQLASHRADPACASCHSEIDPLGTVLENFDPVGRWRERYPVYMQPADGEAPLEEDFYSTEGKGVIPGPPVVTVGILSDGTRLESVADLRRLVLTRADEFAACLAEKLLAYGTGRAPGFADRRVAQRIARDAVARGAGFRDLLVAVVQSEAFSLR